MLEKMYPFLLGIGALVLVYYCKFNLGSLTNYKEIMSSAISLGSIAVGFLAAAITLMPSLSNNELVKNLKRMGAYKKLLSYIIWAIMGLFAVSLLSIFALFVNTRTINTLDKIFFYLWIFAFVFAIAATYRVIRNFLKFLVLTQDEED